MKVCPSCHVQLFDHQTTCQLCGSHLPQAGPTGSTTGKMPLTWDGKCAKFIASDRVLGEGSVSPATMRSKNGF